MLIVLDKPKAEGTLAVNIDAHQQVTIVKTDEDLFNLCLKNYYDAYFSDKSALLFIITTFDTYEKCLYLFHAIVEAKSEGKTVFYLAKYLKDETPTTDPLQNDDLPKV